MIEKHFTVIDKAGLHARPASVLVNVANDFTSDIKISHKERSANLKSILGVMGHGVACGEIFTIQAEGADEEEAVTKLGDTLKNEGLIE